MNRKKKQDEKQAAWMLLVLSILAGGSIPGLLACLLGFAGQAGLICSAGIVLSAVAAMIRILNF